MSDTGRDSDLIPDHTKQNYRTLVTSSSVTWPDLASQFRRDAANVAGARARGYEQLAAWADREAAQVADAAAAPKAARKDLRNAPRVTGGPSRTAT